MEPILSNLAAGTVRSEPRDLQSRFYRQIGISAVAAALEMIDSRAEGSAAALRAKAARKAA